MPSCIPKHSLLFSPSKKVYEAKTEFIRSMTARDALGFWLPDASLTLCFSSLLTNGKKSVPMYPRSTSGT